jgi:signal peptide peptidase SppA
MDLYNILTTLKTKPHCILPEYANALQTKLEKYLSEDMPMFEPEEDEEEIPDPLKNMNGIGVIDINGIIMKRVGLPKTMLDFFGICDLDLIDTQLKALRNDPEVTSIVLNVSSPGGFISGVQSTAMLIDDITKEKEVVVFSDILNASAAYWLSSQASSILSTVDAEIGSIGVFVTYEDWSRAFEQAGVSVKVFKQGKYKAIGVPGIPLTEEQSTHIQSEVDSTYNTFTIAVTQKRKIDPSCMQGQTFNGLDAYNNNLTDGIVKDIDEIINVLSN